MKEIYLNNAEKQLCEYGCFRGPEVLCPPAPLHLSGQRHDSLHLLFLR